MHFALMTQVHLKRFASVFMAAGALLVYGCGGHKELIGKWYVATVGGKSVTAAASQTSAFDFLEGGRFTGIPDESGTWSADGSTITLHKEKIRGMNKEDYLAHYSAKIKANPGSMAGFEELWKDATMNLSSDSKTLTIHRDGYDIVLQKNGSSG